MYIHFSTSFLWDLEASVIRFSRLGNVLVRIWICSFQTTHWRGAVSHPLAIYILNKPERKVPSTHFFFYLAVAAAHTHTNNLYNPVDWIHCRFTVGLNITHFDWMQSALDWFSTSLHHWHFWPDWLKNFPHTSGILMANQGQSLLTPCQPWRRTLALVPSIENPTSRVWKSTFLKWPRWMAWWSNVKLRLFAVTRLNGSCFLFCHTGSVSRAE